MKKKSKDVILTECDFCKGDGSYMHPVFRFRTECPRCDGKGYFKPDGTPAHGKLVKINGVWQ